MKINVVVNIERDIVDLLAKYSGEHNLSIDDSVSEVLHEYFSEILISREISDREEQ